MISDCEVLPTGDLAAWLLGRGAEASAAATEALEPCSRDAAQLQKNAIFALNVICAPGVCMVAR